MQATSKLSKGKSRSKVGEWITILIWVAAVAVTSLYTVILLSDNGVSDDIKAVLVALIGVASAAILQHTFTKRRELAAGQLAHKRVAYEQMLETVLDIIRAPEENSIDQREALFRSKVKAAIWADHDLLMWWIRLNEIDVANLTNDEALPLLEELLGLIRRELGKRDSTLQDRGLVSMFAPSGRQ